MRFHVANVHKTHFNVLVDLMKLLHETLLSLGHETTAAIGPPISGAQNIILGHTWAEDFADAEDFIVFQVEPLLAQDWRFKWHRMRPVLERPAVIWDYNQANVDFLKQEGFTNVHYVPLGYHEKLHTIPKLADEPLDILFYGTPTPHRHKIAQDLTRWSNNVRFTTAFGERRDALIAQSKVVLNLHQYPGQHFESVRVHYLLNNARFVLCEHSADNPYGDAVLIEQTDEIAAAAIRYAQDRDQREALRQASFELFRKMPMTDILARVLQ